MSIDELSRDQIIELKQKMLEEVLGEEPSWHEIATADSIVTDEQVEEEYGGINFVEDDFFCSAIQSDVDEVNEMLRDDHDGHITNKDCSIEVSGTDRIGYDLYAYVNGECNEHRRIAYSGEEAKKYVRGFLCGLATAKQLYLS